MLGFILFVIIVFLLCRAYIKFMKNSLEDYRFMLSESEPRDHKQSLSDKICTSMADNNFVQNMVDVSMLNHDNDE